MKNVIRSRQQHQLKKITLNLKDIYSTAKRALYICNVAANVGHEIVKIHTQLVLRIICEYVDQLPL
jgi:hypothetical protein